MKNVFFSKCFLLINFPWEEGQCYFHFLLGGNPVKLLRDYTE